MKNAILLTLALGLVMLFSSAALAEFGECSHVTQAQRAVTNNGASAKAVAAKDTKTAKGDKLVRLQEEDLQKPEVSKK